MPGGGCEGDAVWCPVRGKAAACGSRRHPERMRRWPLSSDSGESDLESAMETPSVVGESSGRILESMEEPVDEEGEAAMLRRGSWRVNDTRPETGQVGADLGGLVQEALQEGSGGGALSGIRTEALQSLKLTDSADESLEEEP